MNEENIYINFKIHKLSVNKYLLSFNINLLCLKHLLTFVSQEYADWFIIKTENLSFRLICVTDIDTHTKHILVTQV